MAAARLLTPIEPNIDNSWPLFKIEKDGKVSYILGTVHLLPLKALPESNNRIARVHPKFYIEKIVKRHLPWVSKIIQHHSNSGGTGLPPARSFTSISNTY